VACYSNLHVILGFPVDKFQTLVLNINLENFLDFMNCNTCIWNPRHKMLYSILYNFCFTRQYNLFRITRFLNCLPCCVLFLSMIKMEQKRQCIYKITLFCVHVTTVTTETKQCVLYVIFRYITDIECCTKMLYGEFMSLATVECT